MDVFLESFVNTYGVIIGGVVLAAIVLVVWAVAHRQAGPSDNVSIFFGLASYTKGGKRKEGDEVPITVDEDQYLAALGIKFLSKLEASELVHRKLADPEIRHIAILGYTNEVEAGFLNKYRIQGNKTLEIIKRSPLEDLREEQVCNLSRIVKGDHLRPWRKLKKSVEASLAADAQAVEALLKIEQWCYPDAPQRRAYVFDGVEALVSYYEHAGEPSLSNGSLYKGMSDSQSLLVTRDSRIGRFILDDVNNSIAILKQRSQSWQQEKARIDRSCSGEFAPFNPIMNVSGIMIDLDGVLYDSLPHYVRAWTEAFAGVGVEIIDRDVYMHEGRPGAETVDLLFAQYKKVLPDKQTAEKVLATRDAVLSNFGTPPIQRGAKELLRAIVDLGLSFCVVTGSSREKILDRLERDFSPEFAKGKLIGGRDVPIGKPSPVPFILGAQKLGVKSTSTLTIENAPLGVIAAASAGSFVVGVNTGILENSVLAQAGAKHVFSSCSDLASHLPMIVNELREGASTGVV